MGPIIYMMGVSGSGKTTIGKQLAAETGIPFFDGDDFHSLHNKEKMGAGHPLTDEDRQEWLCTINQLAIDESARQGAIIACSALKQQYRNRLLQGVTAPVHWVLLEGSYQLIHERLSKRAAHFMKAGLLQSQFDILEIPEQAIRIDTAQTQEAIVGSIIQQLNIEKINE